MTEFLALFAVLLPVVVIVGFGVVQERRVRDLAARLDRLDRVPDRASGRASGRVPDRASGRASGRVPDRASGRVPGAGAEDGGLARLRERLDALARRTDQVAAEQAYEQTMSGRRQSVPHIPARISLAAEEQADEVRAAVLAVADAIGFEVAHAYEPARDPYFQWLLLRLRRGDDGRPARRISDLGADVRGVVESRDDLAALVRRAAPAVVQLGPGVLASDGRRLVRIDLTPSQARELERDPAVFTDPERMLALASDAAYRSTDAAVDAAVDPVVDAATAAGELPVRPRLARVDRRAADAGPSVEAPPVEVAPNHAGPDHAGPDLARPDQVGPEPGAPTRAAPDEDVRRAVEDLGRLATRVAQLAADRPASPATRRALEEVERRIAGLEAHVEPVDPVDPSVQGRPVRREAAAGSPQDVLRSWRMRVRRASVTRSAQPRRTEPGGLGAQLKSVADALRGGAAPPPPGPDRDRERR